MGLLRKAAVTLKQAAVPIPMPGGGSARILFGRAGLRDERNYTQEIGDGSGSNLVEAEIAWKMRNLPDAPLALWQGVTDDDEGERVRRHDLLTFLHKPNPGYDSDTLWDMTIFSFDTDGNAYWYLVRNGAGRPVEAWWMPHWLMEPKFPADGSEWISYYQYTPAGRDIRLPVEDVIHFRYRMDPKNLRKGVSPLKTLLREIYTDEEAARYSAAMLHNLGVPGLIVAPKALNDDGQPVPVETAQAAKAQLLQSMRGDSRGEPLVNVWPLDVEQFGFSPEQMNTTELRRIPEERVSAVLGVPAAVVGFGVGLELTKVGATLDTYNEMAWENGLIPLQRRFARTLQDKLLPEFEQPTEGWRIGFDLSDVRALQEDEDSLHARTRADTQAGIITIAAAQRRMGYEVDESQDVYLRPFNLVPVPRGQEAPEPSADAEQRSRQVATKQATSQQLAYARELDAGRGQLVEAMAGELAGIFQRLGDAVADEYLSTKARKQDGADEAETARIIAALSIGATFVDGMLAPVYETYYLRAGEATYGALQSHFGIDLGVGIGLPDPIGVDLVQQGGTRLGLLDLDAQTRSSVLRVLSEGRDAGANPVEIARNLRSQVPAGRFVNAGARYRAELIARTEMRWAQGTAAAIVGEQAGYTRFTILDARLGPTDAECEALNGVEVSAAEVQGYLDSEHANGTRTVVPVPGSQA